MRYSQELQNKIIEESSKTSVEELSKKYDIQPMLIRKWLLLDLTEDQLKTRVRQKFYNIFPVEEAKIVSIFSDHIKEDISDDTWDEVSKKTNKELFEFALCIYKLLRVEFEAINQ